MSDLHDKAELLLRLRTEMAACERWGNNHDRTTVGTGLPALDRVLPGGGILRGSLVEFLDERRGSGAETFAVVLMQAVCPSGGAVVVLDQERQFYPPALAAWGLALESLIVIHAANDAEALWAADQALRSRAVSAVWLRRERLKPHDFRRLRLAAEEGGTLGVLLRPARVRGQPTWADVQFAVGPRPSTQGRRLRVEVTRCRGGTAGPAVDVELDDVTGTVREVGRHETLRVLTTSPLANPAAGRRTARAPGPPRDLAPPRRASG